MGGQRIALPRRGGGRVIQLLVGDAEDNGVADLRGHAGAVRVGAPDAFGACFLAPRLIRLLDQQPGLTVQLVATPRSFNVTKREADIAISLTMPERGRISSRTKSRAKPRR